MYDANSLSTETFLEYLAAMIAVFAYQKYEGEAPLPSPFRALDLVGRHECFTGPIDGIVDALVLRKARSRVHPQDLAQYELFLRECVTREILTRVGESFSCLHTKDNLQAALNKAVLARRRELNPNPSSKQEMKAGQGSVPWKIREKTNKKTKELAMRCLRMMTELGLKFTRGEMHDLMIGVGKEFGSKKLANHLLWKLARESFKWIQCEHLAPPSLSRDDEIVFLTDNMPIDPILEGSEEGGDEEAE